MKTLTVVGPLVTRKEAEDTAHYLGSVNHSVYSMAVKDKDGYETDVSVYFVERDQTVIGKIFGYEPKALLQRQYK